MNKQQYEVKLNKGNIFIKNIGTNNIEEAISIYDKESKTYDCILCRYVIDDKYGFAIQRTDVEHKGNDVFIEWKYDEDLQRELIEELIKEGSCEIPKEVK